MEFNGSYFVVRTGGVYLLGFLNKLVCSKKSTFHISEWRINSSESSRLDYIVLYIILTYIPPTLSSIKEMYYRSIE